MVELLPLAMVEPYAVEVLLDSAFGADRGQRTAYRLREGMAAIPALSFALVDDAHLIGTLQSWPVAHFGADGQISPLVMVGPVAIRPDVQRGGWGRLLMETVLAASQDKADGALMMIGDPEYYSRFFGFSTDATAAWDVPGPVEPRRLLARATGPYVPPAATGRIGPRRVDMLAS